jgi:TatD DNase family protein
MENKECFIDVHCHLDMTKEIPIEKIIENAVNNDVKIMINQGVKPESNRKSLELSEKFKEVKCALGLYPIDSLSLSDSDIDEELDFIRKNKDKIAAIGEVGLDFKESEKKEEYEKQIKTFEKIIDLSIELNKPLIVHSRKAELECIETLEKKKAKKVVMHCFSGKFSLVKKIEQNGWFLTIPTSVKNSEHFQKIIKETKIEQLLCETDSPYLHPDKKWPNEPANVIESYKKIAEIKGISLEETKKKIFENFMRLIG